MEDRARLGKMLVEADLYSPRGAPPDTPSASEVTLHRNIERLKLDIETIVPVHGRIGSMSDFLSWVGETE